MTSRDELKLMSLFVRKLAPLTQAQRERVVQWVAGHVKDWVTEETNGQRLIPDVPPNPVF